MIQRFTKMLQSSSAFIVELHAAFGLYANNNPVIAIIFCPSSMVYISSAQQQ